MASSHAHEERRCLICNHTASYYFSKEYGSYPGSPFADALQVNYYRCGACGFTFSGTHQDMSEATWAALNTSWHHYFEGGLESRGINQPPYADQALALTLLSRNGLIELSGALDYAAGYGTLAKVLRKYFGTGIQIYDKYVNGSDDLGPRLKEADLRKYELVMNSAMFEHVVARGALDEVNDLVSDTGVLMLHTVICENVPKDPNWFYLNPIVHTAFHTNRSMSRLMEQWGFAASVYAPQAKSWFLFKRDYPALDRLERDVDAINRELQCQYFLYKAGFVDYWKGF